MKLQFHRRAPNEAVPLWCRYFAERFDFVLVRGSITATTLIPSLNGRNIRQEFSFYPTYIRKSEQIREMQISPSIDLPKKQALEN